MDRRKIVRIIARLNIGGPARQVVFLSDEMTRLGWSTLLILGQPDPTEGDMGYLLANRSVRFLRLPTLQRKIRPLKDLKAWWDILRSLFQERPHILHTHTAKAGALGRSAGWVYRGLTRRPLKMVHTFHGHVLEGYFDRFRTQLFCRLERFLARPTDCLIAVSESVRQDLVSLRIAPASKIRVIPLGLPLQSLLKVDPPAPGTPIRIGMVGRLVPIKNHKLLFEAIQILKKEGAEGPFQFVLIGDGELRSSLEVQAQRMGIGTFVQFTGWQSQMPAVYEGLHLVCLTSQNEGTPVSLIEAMAAARPVVATDVGGVRGLLTDSHPKTNGAAIPQGSFEVGQRGILIPSGDAQGLAQSLRFLATHPEVGLKLGESGRRFVAERFSQERLLQDIDRLYREFL